MRHKSLTTVLLLTTVIFFSLVGSSTARHTRSKPYIAGQGGYHTYRTPAIVKAHNGDLLAFCGARHGGSGDNRPCDIVLRRSSDRGHTWKSMQKIVGNGTDRFAIPVPVVLDCGTILLLYLKSDVERTYREAHMRFSTDNGKTWSRRWNITDDVHKGEYGEWFGIGPTKGIVKQFNPHKGRIIIGARYSPPNGTSRSYVVYSDDDGSTWNIGGELSIRSSEVAVAELPNGNIMLNARAVNSAHKHRIVGVSTDGGETFSSTWHETQLPCPQRCGSLLRRGNSILFSNPRNANIDTNGNVQRSVDNGQTWPWRRRYTKIGEFSSYSDTVYDNGGVGVLAEWGPSDNQRHKEIRYYHVRRGLLGF